MVSKRIRHLSAFVMRYGILYPAIVTGSIYVATMMFAPTFETGLFAVFAAVTVIIGFGAMNGSSANDTVHSTGGFGATSNSGERWNKTLLVKLALFDLGLALVLTLYTFW